MVKRILRRRPALLLGLLCLVISASGCTSPEAFRQALDERDQEIQALREERAELKRERQALLASVDSLGSELRDANSRLVQRPEPVEAAAHPGLTSLGVDYSYRGGLAVITIPSAISFPSGLADLSKEGKKALRAVAGVLKAEHGTGVYYIEGHTDSDPIVKSKFETNRALSLARATAVHGFLVEECDIPDEQCVVVGHGQYRPRDPGTSSAAKAKNRRVEIVVHGSKP